MTRDLWLAKHPYLQPLADLDAVINVALGEVTFPRARIPAWDDYITDFRDGIPLLQSAAIDLDWVGSTMTSLVHTLTTKHLPGSLASEILALESELLCDTDSSRRDVAWLLNGHSCSPAHAGLFHYLGWTILARHLYQLVGAFASWRNEENWFRSYCPTCGNLPAMAQLTGTDPPRLRLLACGFCTTRWQYYRTGCPFCENKKDNQHEVLAIEGDSNLRIDSCKSCGAYLKTYDGQGSESVFLADWTSIHLDVIARDHGLKRLAGSLFDF
jgi:FdhE protein